MKILATIQAVVLAALVSACSPEKGVEGTWQFRSTGDNCAISYLFEENNNYVGMFMCVRGNAIDAFVEGGTYTDVGNKLNISVARSSCPEVSEKNWSVTYQLQNDADTLALVDEDRVLVLNRSPKSSGDGTPGGVIIKTGCFTDAGFIQQPIRDL